MPPHVAATLIGAEIATPPLAAEIVKPSAPKPPRFTIQRTGNRIREVDTLTGEVVADFTIEGR